MLTSYLSAAALRRSGGAILASSGLSQHLASAPAFTAFPRLASGQDVKEGTENFDLSAVAGPVSSDDGPDAILYDPTSEGVAEVVSNPPPPTTAQTYTPRWQRGKTTPPETNKATSLPDTDPVFKTENDIKDM